MRDSNKSIKIIQIDVCSDESIARAADEISRIVADEGLNLLVNNSGILEKARLIDFFLPKQIVRKAAHPNAPIGTFFYAILT